MNIEEYKSLDDIEERLRLITIEDLQDKSDRTLLYGYTCSRDTWHVYIKSEKIFVIMYSSETITMEVEDNYKYVPDKRLYPERCDYEFCKLLKEKGIELPFTIWHYDMEEKKYYGKVL